VLDGGTLWVPVSICAAKPAHVAHLNAAKSIGASSHFGDPGIVPRRGTGWSKRTKSADISRIEDDAWQVCAVTLHR
jgi:hypothetical protein